MGPHIPSGAPLATYIVPIGVAVLVLILRNSRPRALKIERLWLLPVIYLFLLASTLAAAPPPVTAVSIGLLVLAFVVGAAIGWQRGRLMQIHIHPETHELSSRASPIGLAFIFAILVLRYAASAYLADNAAVVGLPIMTVGDAFIVLAVAMLSTQRLEVWQRASRMLAEAKAGSEPPPIVS